MRRPTSCRSREPRSAWSNILETMRSRLTSRSAVIVYLAALVACVWTGAVQAQQPITGNYAPGASTGMKGMVQPPAGTFVLENGTLWFRIQDFVGSDGQTVPTATSNVLANRTIFGYVTHLKILGGEYFPSIIPVFANAPLRPEPNSERDFQFSDLVLQPVALGWRHGALHSQFAYTVWLPTGRFNAGASNNVGKGLYAHMLSYGVTWLQETEQPWAATLNARYELLGRQRDTDIDPGDVLTVEGGLGKEIVSGLDLGVSGYFSTQTTEETGSPPTTDTSRYRFGGLGPEINWRPGSLPGFQATVRSYVDLGGRNTSQGIFTVFSFMYVFSAGSQ